MSRERKFKSPTRDASEDFGGLRRTNRAPTRMTQYVARLAYRPSTRHAALGPDFYDVVEPAAFPQHILRVRNQRWAARVGLDPLTDEEWIAHFGRFEPLPGGFPQPLALRYHGHQFRSYNPQLGGRARLSVRATLRPSGRAVARSRHQGQRPDALVARGRWTADAQRRG